LAARVFRVAGALSEILRLGKPAFFKTNDSHLSLRGRGRNLLPNPIEAKNRVLFAKKYDGEALDGAQATLLGDVSVVRLGSYLLV